MAIQISIKRKEQLKKKLELSNVFDDKSNIVDISRKQLKEHKVSEQYKEREVGCFDCVWRSMGC